MCEDRVKESKFVVVSLVILTKRVLRWLSMRRYTSLRLVPAYQSSIQESFQRCLDLYLCARKFSKARTGVDPESLIPKLPSPKDLMPFPNMESFVFKGHTSCVVSISVDPTGQWLASGSLDKTVRFWEVSTGRCRHVMNFADEVAAVKWCPKAALSLIAIAAGSQLYLVNPKLGPYTICDGTDTMLKPLPPTKADDDDAKKPSAVAWTPATPAEFTQGIRFVLSHSRTVEKVTWHKQGVYLATVEYTGTVGAVLFHAIRRQHSMVCTALHRPCCSGGTHCRSRRTAARARVCVWGG